MSYVEQNIPEVASEIGGEVEKMEGARDSARLDWMIQNGAMVTEGMTHGNGLLYIGFIVVTPLDDRQSEMPMDSARDAIDAAMNGAPMVNADPTPEPEDDELMAVLSRIAWGSCADVDEAIPELRAILNRGSEEDDMPFPW